MGDPNNNRNTYGGIFKALALFGGVKIVQIIISIIRSKLIAILIGPTGMGISNLLTSTTNTLNSITGCGLHTSAVREVAKSYNQHLQEDINRTITTLRGLTWLTGLVGAILVLAFAKPLSIFAFGNSDYTAAFRILSIMMVFMQINVGQTALLQGCFHYKDMARATVEGQMLSLVLTVPLYYFFREKGIVPALLIASFITVVMSTIYARRVNYQKVRMTMREFWQNGKGMIALGVVIALGGQISNASSYLMNVIISHLDSVEAVGLYSAAITMANSYVFLVLSAMTTDYVPRLSAIVGDDKEQIIVINKQMEMVMMIITPLLIAFMVFAREAILILYSSEFLAVVHMLEFLMFGMFFRAISWCLSYAFIARGDSKIFLMNESIIFFISLSLKFTGFYFGSYTGIGIAIILVYVAYCLLMFIVCKHRFKFKLSIGFYKIASACLGLCGIALAVSNTGGISWWRYLIGVVTLILSIVYSYNELDKRIHISRALATRINKSHHE